MECDFLNRHSRCSGDRLLAVLGFCESARSGTGTAEDKAVVLEGGAVFAIVSVSFAQSFSIRLCRLDVHEPRFDKVEIGVGGRSRWLFIGYAAIVVVIVVVVVDMIGLSFVPFDASMSGAIKTVSKPVSPGP